MIIDAHTHYGVCYEERDGLDVRPWLDTLTREGVDGAILTGHRSMLALPDIPAANDALAEVAAQAPDRVIAFGTVHPFAGKEALREAERCFVDLGMRGMKLHPWLQGFPFLGGEPMHELCDLCGSFDGPMLFHDGTSNVSMPSQVANLARTHPRTTFILGHAGLMHLWRQAAEAARLFDNVHVTLCGPHPAALRYICDVVPTERLLWGSDFGFAFVNVTGYRKRVMKCVGLSGSQYQAIMGQNAARLLNWRPASHST